MSYDFQDVLLVPRPISTVFSRRIPSIYNNDGIFPVSASNMEGVGTFEVCKVLAKHKMLTYIHKKYTLEEWYKFIDSVEPKVLEYCVPTFGATYQEGKKAQTLLSNHGQKFKRFCVDVANGHTLTSYNAFLLLKRAFPHLVSVYGNIANPLFLIEVQKIYGELPDCIKIGIGSGSVCTTRLKTGVGVPQFSLIKSTVEYADSFGVQVISDGGCRQPGDIVKAFVAGADEVMLGGMLAYTDESEAVYSDGSVAFYGSSSHFSSSFNPSKTYITEEGKFTRKPSRGSIANIVKDIQGGIRSAMTYLNTESLDGLINAEYTYVNRQVDNY